MKSLIESGSLRPNDLVWREGMPGWVEANTISEFFPPGTLAPSKTTLLAKPVEEDDPPPQPIQVRVQQLVERDEEERPRRRRRRAARPSKPWVVRGVFAGVFILAAVLVLLFVWVEAQYQALGNRLVFNGGEVYYTSAVTRAEAERLGNHLVRTGFFDGDRKSVQLHREGRWYQFRMVVKKGIEHDLQYNAVLKLFIEELSREVFDGQPVEIHLCDDHLRTIRVVVNPSIH